MITSVLQKLKRRFFADTSGNFGMMTAILLPVLLGAAGAGMELANIMQVKADLQNTADSAALAAATEARLKEGAMTDEQIRQIAKAFIAAQLVNNLTEDEKKALEENSPTNITTTENARGKTYTVETTINYRMKLNPFIGFLGAKTLDLAATGTAKSTVNKGAPISMYLVLDRSGSMSFKTDTINTAKKSCPNYTSSNWGRTEAQVTSSPCYVNKATSLKTAVGFLVATLNKADPTYTANGGSQLVRTGASVYTHETYPAQAITWGTNSIVTYVDKQIPEFPTGGTDARSSLNAAYNALKKANTDEAKAHKSQDNVSFERYIVLMTDGEMTGNSAAWNSSIDQSVRTTCETAKKDGIKIFSVAFMAPDNGKSLLQYCASSLDNYYAPENMEQIVTAFGEIARKAAGSIATLTN
ncbi:MULTISPECIES: TadE/TadG family type IV pilus assembly protein [unclassified Agrobacterium]|uniref:vWA domain-containing protein n=1 Tax=unclassified Agrobacterium TaxID=2632611 RepID=UPI00244C0B28|nr:MULTISPECIES: TadE/TadG family type IV pilus assembly protein [unclassified Agrobacterium]MDH0611929.1 pilus assembly protein TadG-related protein [Agrobacterium sp. GD03872]MDH0695826.1 pilus assembly protein TadG-related protein [Agrobacterium sp. GD03871]MDH1058900.1 pilus assembly protein TadG-related protein [Agrobacterium sp. GD03992]MDH2210991.1 pilus assembly protein TadG-related protein [Agrobacterium sp. GD03643]MDH2217592.1 pilus assembly protein TadG-related protein [Agrobacteri